MTEAKLIYADFMRYDFEKRLILSCFGTHRDLVKYDITLENELKLFFYSDDEDEFGNEDNLVVQGVVGYDKTHERWVAIIDWDEIKNISRLSTEEKEKFGLL